MKILQPLRQTFIKISHRFTQSEHDHNQRSLEKAQNGERFGFVTLYGAAIYDCRDPQGQEKWVKHFSQKVQDSSRRLESFK